MRIISRALDKEGYQTLNLGYDSRSKDLAALADDIHPAVVAFSDELTGPLHIVTHSMGGLLARLYLAHRRPPRLGRVAMMGPPNDGSAVADLLHRSTVYRAFFGPAGQQLTTHHAAALRRLCGSVDYELGIIAGTRPANVFLSTLMLREPSDGKVAVRSTRLAGMTDHIELPVTHSHMMRDPAVVDAVLAFLGTGRFR